MRLKEALQKDLIYEVAKYDKFVTPVLPHLIICCLGRLELMLVKF